MIAEDHIENSWDRRKEDNWTDTVTCLEELENEDQEMKSEKAFKCLLKSYTGISLFGGINQLIRKGQFGEIQCYLTTLLNTLKEYGKDMEYKDYGKPVFRGIREDHSDKYRVNDIMYWPCFASTSTDFKVALGFSKQGTIFKIFLCGENSPVTS